MQKENKINNNELITENWPFYREKKARRKNGYKRVTYYSI